MNNNTTFDGDYYKDNIRIMRENTTYDFMHEEHLILFREPGKPRINFNPRDGRWTNRDTGESYKGGAKEFLDWYSQYDNVYERGTKKDELLQRLNELRLCVEVTSCDCCGTNLEYAHHNKGEYLNYEEVLNLLKELNYI